MTPKDNEVLTDYSEDGVDLTLIRWMLSLTPLPHCAEKDLGERLRVRVLNLEMLIAIKEELGGEKALAVLPVLRCTLEERRKLGYTPQQ